MFKDLFRWQIRYIEIVAFLIGFFLIVVLLQFFATEWWLYLFLIPLILLGSHYYKEISSYWRIMLVGAYSGVITWNIFKISRIITVNTFNPPEWDFLAFWLNGRIASQGLNFYLPSHYLGYDLPVSISQDFTREVLEVGFWYPPPSILLFFPLGWFDSLDCAYLSWQLLMVTVLAITIFLLWRLFLDKSNVLGLLVSGALVLLLPATYYTLHTAQTNFLVLLAILLFLVYSEHFLGGIWLGIGIVIKPFAGLLFLFSVLQRRWQVVASSIITYGFLSLITIILFGFTTFSSYFSERPVSKIPDSVYIEGVNQSLLAQILRLTNYDFSEKSPLFNPIFIVITIVLLTTTSLLAFFLKKDDAVWALALTLLTALLIYPGTLIHYSVLLIIPMLILWKYRNRLVGGLWGSVFVITLTYIFILKNWKYVFLATLLYWFVFATIGSWIALVRSGNFRQIDQLSNMLQRGS